MTDVTQFRVKKALPISTKTNPPPLELIFALDCSENVFVSTRDSWFPNTDRAVCLIIFFVRALLGKPSAEAPWAKGAQYRDCTISVYGCFKGKRNVLPILRREVKLDPPEVDKLVESLVKEFGAFELAAREDCLLSGKLDLKSLADSIHDVVLRADGDATRKCRMLMIATDLRRIQYDPSGLNDVVRLINEINASYFAMLNCAAVNFHDRNAHDKLRIQTEVIMQVAHCSGGRSVYCNSAVTEWINMHSKSYEFVKCPLVALGSSPLYPRPTCDAAASLADLIHEDAMGAIQKAIGKQVRPVVARASEESRVEVSESSRLSAQAVGAAELSPGEEFLENYEVSLMTAEIKTLRRRSGWVKDGKKQEPPASQVVHTWHKTIFAALKKEAVVVYRLKGYEVSIVLIRKKPHDDMATNGMCAQPEYKVDELFEVYAAAIAEEAKSLDLLAWSLRSEVRNDIRETSDGDMCPDVPFSWNCLYTDAWKKCCIVQAIYFYHDHSKETKNKELFSKQIHLRDPSVIEHPEHGMICIQRGNTDQSSHILNIKEHFNIIEVVVSFPVFEVSCRKLTLDMLHITQRCRTDMNLISHLCTKGRPGALEMLSELVEMMKAGKRKPDKTELFTTFKTEINHWGFDAVSVPLVYTLLQLNRKEHIKVYEANDTDTHTSFVVFLRSFHLVADRSLKQSQYYTCILKTACGVRVAHLCNQDFQQTRGLFKKLRLRDMVIAQAFQLFEFVFANKPLHTFADGDVLKRRSDVEEKVASNTSPPIPESSAQAPSKSPSLIPESTVQLADELESEINSEDEIEAFQSELTAPNHYDSPFDWDQVTVSIGTLLQYSSMDMQELCPNFDRITHHDPDGKPRREQELSIYKLVDDVENRDPTPCLFDEEELASRAVSESPTEPEFEIRTIRPAVAAACEALYSRFQWYTKALAAVEIIVPSDNFNPTHPNYCEKAAAHRLAMSGTGDMKYFGIHLPSFNEGNPVGVILVGMPAEGGHIQLTRGLEAITPNFLLNFNLITRDKIGKEPVKTEAHERQVEYSEDHDITISQYSGFLKFVRDLHDLSISYGVYRLLQSGEKITPRELDQCLRPLVEIPSIIESECPITQTPSDSDDNAAAALYHEILKQVKSFVHSGFVPLVGSDSLFIFHPRTAKKFKPEPPPRREKSSRSRHSMENPDSVSCENAEECEERTVSGRTSHQDDESVKSETMISTGTAHTHASTCEDFRGSCSTDVPCFLRFALVVNKREMARSYKLLRVKPTRYAVPILNDPNTESFSESLLKQIKATLRDSVKVVGIQISVVTIHPAFFPITFNSFAPDLRGIRGAYDTIVNHQKPENIVSLSSTSSINIIADVTSYMDLPYHIHECIAKVKKRVGVASSKLSLDGFVRKRFDRQLVPRIHACINTINANAPMMKEDPITRDFACLIATTDRTNHREDFLKILEECTLWKASSYPLGDHAQGDRIFRVTHLCIYASEVHADPTAAILDEERVASLEPLDSWLHIVVKESSADDGDSTLIQPFPRIEYSVYVHQESLRDAISTRVQVILEIMAARCSRMFILREMAEKIENGVIVSDLVVEQDLASEPGGPIQSVDEAWRKFHMDKIKPLHYRCPILATIAVSIPRAGQQALLGPTVDHRSYHVSEFLAVGAFMATNRKNRKECYFVKPVGGLVGALICKAYWTEKCEKIVIDIHGIEKPDDQFIAAWKSNIEESVTNFNIATISGYESRSAGRLHAGDIAWIKESLGEYEFRTVLPCTMDDFLDALPRHLTEQFTVLESIKEKGKGEEHVAMSSDESPGRPPEPLSRNFILQEDWDSTHEGDASTQTVIKLHTKELVFNSAKNQPKGRVADRVYSVKPMSSMTFAYVEIMMFSMPNTSPPDSWNSGALSWESIGHPSSGSASEVGLRDCEVSLVHSGKSPIVVKVFVKGTDQSIKESIFNGFNQALCSNRMEQLLATTDLDAPHDANEFCLKFREHAEQSSHVKILSLTALPAPVLPTFLLELLSDVMYLHHMCQQGDPAIIMTTLDEHAAKSTKLVEMKFDTPLDVSANINLNSHVFVLLSGRIKVNNKKEIHNRQVQALRDVVDGMSSLTPVVEASTEERKCCFVQFEVPSGVHIVTYGWAIDKSQVFHDSVRAVCEKFAKKASVSLFAFMQRIGVYQNWHHIAPLQRMESDLEYDHESLLSILEQRGPRAAPVLQKPRVVEKPGEFRQGTLMSQHQHQKYKAVESVPVREAPAPKSSQVFFPSVNSVLRQQWGCCYPDPEQVQKQETEKETKSPITPAASLVSEAHGAEPRSGGFDRWNQTKCPLRATAHTLLSARKVERVGISPYPKFLAPGQHREVTNDKKAEAELLQLIHSTRKFQVVVSPFPIIHWLVSLDPAARQLWQPHVDKFVNAYCEYLRQHIKGLYGGVVGESCVVVRQPSETDNWAIYVLLDVQPPPVAKLLPPARIVSNEPYMFAGKPYIPISRTSSNTLTPKQDYWETSTTSSSHKKMTPLRDVRKKKEDPKECCALGICCSVDADCQRSSFHLYTNEKTEVLQDVFRSALALRDQLHINSFCYDCHVRAIYHRVLTLLFGTKLPHSLGTHEFFQINTPDPFTGTPIPITHVLNSLVIWPPYSLSKVNKTSWMDPAVCNLNTWQVSSYREHHKHLSEILPGVAVEKEEDFSLHERIARRFTGVEIPDETRKCLSEFVHLRALKKSQKSIWEWAHEDPYLKRSGALPRLVRDTSITSDDFCIVFGIETDPGWVGNAFGKACGGNSIAVGILTTQPATGKKCANVEIAASSVFKRYQFSRKAKEATGDWVGGIIATPRFNVSGFNACQTGEEASDHSEAHTSSYPPKQLETDAFLSTLNVIFMPGADPSKRKSSDIELDVVESVTKDFMKQVQAASDLIKESIALSNLWEDLFIHREAALIETLASLTWNISLRDRIAADKAQKQRYPQLLFCFDQMHDWAGMISVLVRQMECLGFIAFEAIHPVDANKRQFVFEVHDNFSKLKRKTPPLRSVVIAEVLAHGPGNSSLELKFMRKVSKNLPNATQAWHVTDGETRFVELVFGWLLSGIPTYL